MKANMALRSVLFILLPLSIAHKRYMHSFASIRAIWNDTFYLALIADNATNDLLVVSSTDGVYWGTQSVGQASFLFVHPP
jgi:hypothetical protein